MWTERVLFLTSEGGWLLLMLFRKQFMSAKNEIESRYKGSAGEDYHAGVHDISAESDIWVRRCRKSKIQPVVSKLNSKVILEFGVGKGYNIINIEAEKKFAYDLAEHLKVFYENTDTEFVSSIENLSERIDLVICHHVLEHVPDPVGVLDLLKSKLKADGKILIHVPYECGRRFKKPIETDKDFHIYSWNPQTLSNLAKMAGFRIEKIKLRRFGYDFFASRISMKLHAGEFGYKIIRKICNWIRPVYEIELLISLK